MMATIVKSVYYTEPSSVTFKIQWFDGKPCTFSEVIAFLAGKVITHQNGDMSFKKLKESEEGMLVEVTTYAEIQFIDTRTNKKLLDATL